MSESFSDKLKRFRASTEERSKERALVMAEHNSSEDILANNSFWAKLMKAMFKELTETMMKDHPSRCAYSIAIMGVDLMQRVDQLEREIAEKVHAGVCGGKGSVLALAENQRWTESAHSVPDTLERLNQQVAEHVAMEGA